MPRPSVVKFGISPGVLDMVSAFLVVAASVIIPVLVVYGVFEYLLDRHRYEERIEMREKRVELLERKAECDE